MCHRLISRWCFLAASSALLSLTSVLYKETLAAAAAISSPIQSPSEVAAVILRRRPADECSSFLLLLLFFFSSVSSSSSSVSSSIFFYGSSSSSSSSSCCSSLTEGDSRTAVRPPERQFAGAAVLRFVFEDQIDFIKASVIDGDKFEDLPGEVPEKSREKSALKMLQISS